MVNSTTLAERLYYKCTTLTATLASDTMATAIHSSIQWLQLVTMIQMAQTHDFRQKVARGAPQELDTGIFIMNLFLGIKSICNCIVYLNPNTRSVSIQN